MKLTIKGEVLRNAFFSSQDGEGEALFDDLAACFATSRPCLDLLQTC